MRRARGGDHSFRDGGIRTPIGYPMESEEEPLSSDDEAELAERAAMLAAGAEAAERTREKDQEWREQGGSVRSSLSDLGDGGSSNDGDGTGGGWAATVARKRAVAAATTPAETSGGWARTKARKQSEAAAKAVAQAAAPPLKVKPGIARKGLYSDEVGWCWMLLYFLILAGFVWKAYESELLTF